MKTQILKIRVALYARSLDIAKLIEDCSNFAPRSLMLARTTAQQARMLLGDTLRLMGEVTPYPQADNPDSKEIAPTADTAGDYDPALPTDEIAAIKTVRQRLEEQIAQLAKLRREIWARNYESLAELVFDRAYTELVLSKNWLGMELKEIATTLAETKTEVKAPTPVIPPPPPNPVIAPTSPNAMPAAAAPVLAPVVAFERAAATPAAISEQVAGQTDTAAAPVATTTAVEEVAAGMPPADVVAKN